jgi:hypothetical protein
MAETTFNLLTNDAYIEKMDAQVAALNEIAGAITGTIATPESWEDVQRVVRAGVAKRIFSVGQLIESTYNGTKCHWQVLDFDRDAENSMTIGLVEAIPSIQFDSGEAMYYADAALAAGTYNFVFNNVTYQFTTTVELPAGGVICIGTFVNDTPTKASLYETRQSTTALETVDASVGSSGTSLGTCDGTTLNQIHRIRYGSNNYKESAIRQWLNSSKTKGSVWTPQTKYDRPPSWNTTLDGFQSLLDPELVAVATAVTKKVNRNTVTDGGGYDEVKDKFWLLSEREVFMPGNGTKIEGDEPYAYYKNFSDYTSASNSADKNRIKYSLTNSTSAQYWWLRSPDVSHFCHVRYVFPTGAYANGNAYGAIAAAPACCIA